MKICKVPKCGQLHQGKGYCNKHYQRFLKGTVIDRISVKDERRGEYRDGYFAIPIGFGAKDGYFIVDKGFSYLDEYKWGLTKKGYASAWVNGESRLAHHLIIGSPPEGMMTDHKDGNRLNNTSSNLRHVTAHQNSMNRAANKNSVSGFKGVYRHKDKWRSVITINKKKKHLGLFDVKEDAAKAYDDMAVELFGVYARKNLL